MRIFSKALAAMALCASSAFVPAVTAPAAAQSAVRLTPELLELTWFVVAYKGQSDDMQQASTITIAGDRAEGTTDCDSLWQADVHVNLPQVHFSNVKAAPIGACATSAEVQKFLTLLTEVRSVRTGVDGLEFLSASNQRLLLAVAGG